VADVAGRDADAIRREELPVGLLAVQDDVAQCAANVGDALVAERGEVRERRADPGTAVDRDGRKRAVVAFRPMP